jgi:D-sedoheptulose 7-phosphate isomerase
MMMKNVVEQRLQESVETISALIKQQEAIQHMADELVACLKNGNKLLICGNGGSAADSQHFAAELVGRLQRDRAPLPAMALSTDTSILTAIGNDYSYDEVFSKQVEALARPGDILIGISTSGRSGNVLKAVEAARRRQVKTFALSGKDGGPLAQAVDQAIVVPSRTSQHIQEGHIAIIHIWCEIIEDTLFPVEVALP